MRWQISNMEVGRPGRAMGQQSPSHAMSNIWGKNTATWRNSKPNSASHSETILSASLLMAASWIMLLDNWIYSFGKKSNLFRDSRIPLQKANKQTDSYTGGRMLRQSPFSDNLWAEVRMRAGLGGGNGHQAGNEAAFCPAELAHPQHCSFQLTFWNIPHLAGVMPARVIGTCSKLISYKRHAGSTQAAYLPVVLLAQESFTPCAALSSSAVIVKCELANWVILFLVVTGTRIKGPPNKFPFTFMGMCLGTWFGLMKLADLQLGRYVHI